MTVLRVNIGRYIAISITATIAPNTNTIIGSIVALIILDLWSISWLYWSVSLLKIVAV